MTIREIMQVGVGLPDRGKFESFARDMLAFSVLRSSDGRISYVRADQYQHRMPPAQLRNRFCAMLVSSRDGSEQLAGWAASSPQQASLSATVHRRSAPSDR